MANSRLSNRSNAVAPGPGDAWAPLVSLGLPPEALAEAQRDYMAEAGTIWNRLLQPPAEHAPIADRRFAAGEWSSQPSSAFLAELYLLNARTLTRLADSLEGDEKTRARIRFAVLQWIDAASPSNYRAECRSRAGRRRARGCRHGSRSPSSALRD